MLWYEELCDSEPLPVNTHSCLHLSRLSTQMSDLIYVLQRDLIQMQHAECTVLGGVGLYWTCIPLF